ncbi:MAG: MBL fold metallo-hydrolase [Actinobacteria bacterium]|nr:MBL fold metallo-hydrolase [Actinomycetota bacterium]
MNKIGTQLAKEISYYRPAKGKLAIWWLGQSGFIIKSRNVCVAIDLYLSNRLERMTADSRTIQLIRMTQIPVTPDLLTFIDYIFCTHDHGDHYDPETIVPLLKSNPSAKVIVPPVAVESLIGDGIAPNLIISSGTNDIKRLGHITVETIPGKHNEFDYTKEYGFPYVGYILTIEGITIYHAGDTIYFDDLLEHLRNYDIQIAFVPINGGDKDRTDLGFMSNLQYYEAADLCANVAVDLIVPCHFDMFTNNTEFVGRFVNYVNSKQYYPQYWIPVVGDMFVYPNPIGEI